MPCRSAHRLAALAGVALLLISAPAARAAFVDGKRYLAMSDDQRTMYMAGLADMMARMVGVSVPDEMKRQTRFERCLYNMTEVQIRELMDAFMHEDPSTVQYTMASNFRAALDLACPAFPPPR
jgi:hypothetical protein